MEWPWRWALGYVVGSDKVVTVVVKLVVVVWKLSWGWSRTWASPHLEGVVVEQQLLLQIHVDWVVDLVMVVADTV